MDAASIASLATTMAETGVKQAVGTAVLKKAMDAELETAQALLQALPPVPSQVNLPAHLGQNVNTTA
ncbi:MAG: hypothetical protein H6R01_1838 [Burkholderiaceae bacterium]|nr:hypothetical protein [Burkholderiaceae bacterium]